MSANTGMLQAFVELRAEDVEATSAHEVAHARLAAGARLQALRRVRVFELTGTLPDAQAAKALLHRSTRFYNPAKERCTVRMSASEAAPFDRDESLVLVLDRGLERRPAAERWWRHETGHKVEVREGLAWALRFEPGVDAARESESLAAVEDRATGLLCNPHFQDWRPGSGGSPPWPWLTAPEQGAKGRNA